MAWSATVLTTKTYEGLCDVNCVAVWCEAGSLGICWLILVLLGIIRSVSSHQQPVTDKETPRLTSSSSNSHLNLICGNHSWPVETQMIWVECLTPSFFGFFLRPNKEIGVTCPSDGLYLEGCARKLKTRCI